MPPSLFYGIYQVESCFAYFQNAVAFDLPIRLVDSEEYTVIGVIGGVAMGCFFIVRGTEIISLRSADAEFRSRIEPGFLHFRSP